MARYCERGSQVFVYIAYRLARLQIPCWCMRSFVHRCAAHVRVPVWLDMYELPIKVLTSLASERKRSDEVSIAVVDGSLGFRFL